MHDEQRSSAHAARAPELQALLRELDDLRLSLATDLSLAAAAVEAGSPDLAGAVVEGDRAELADFERRALQHLAAAFTPEIPDAREGVDPVFVDPVPVVPARRRRSLLAAVTPLLATAAAVLGVLAGVVPTGGAQAEPGQGTQTAMATYQELTQLTREGADAAEVARAAERLHDELAAIVAQASSDPAAAQAALALLESEARVLDGSVDRDQLTGVIAEAMSMVARLRAALPEMPVRAPRVPSPTTAPDDVLVPAEAPSAPVLPEPSIARPEPSPEPSAQTAPAPSQSPSPQPSPSDSASPSSSGGAARDGEPVLPDAVLPPD